LLDSRWTAEVQPALQRAGVATLDGLIQLALERERRSQEIQDALSAAAQLEQRVADQRDWDGILAGSQRGLAAAEEALGLADRDALDVAAAELGVRDLADIESRLGALRIERSNLDATEREFDAELKVAKATSVQKQKALAALQVDLLQAESSVTG